MVYIPRWQIILILAICVLGLAFAAPNLLDRTASDKLPDWLPNKQMNLGLDLRGGSHLLLEVQTSAVIKERMEGLADSVRNELRQAQVRFGDLRVDGTSVVFGVREPGDLDKARSAARKLIGTVASSGGLFTGGGSDIAVDVTPNNEIRVTMSETAIKTLRDHAIAQAIEVIRRRIDEFGVREPTIQQEGEERIVVQVPGLSNPEELKKLLGQTAKMTFHLVDVSVAPSPGMRPPPGSEILPDASNANQQYLVQRRVMVSGENLTDAQATFQEGQPVVSFRFDTLGARRFADVTKNNVGRPFAIVLDGKVISAPVIREPILGGSGIISGHFTVQSANELALLLRAGALPAPLKIVEERTVGAGLGADFDRGGQDRQRRGHGPGGRVHDLRLRPVRRHGRYRARHQPDLDRGLPVAAPGDADPAGHRRHRAHHRHGGRRQRADLRAHPRGGARRAHAHFGDRFRATVAP